jgi:hypothetical protein
MNVLHGHAICDGPHNDPATVPLASPAFEEWKRIAGPGAPEAHLCPRCTDLLERGLLTHDYVLVCFRCGRNSALHPELRQWWGVPHPNEPGRQVSICEDCRTDGDAFEV